MTLPAALQASLDNGRTLPCAEYLPYRQSGATCRVHFDVQVGSYFVTIIKAQVGFTNQVSDYARLVENLRAFAVPADSGWEPA